VKRPSFHVGRGDGGRAAAQTLSCAGTDRNGQPAAPTRTLRNRAGEAPWVISATWPGCPFPQLVTPQGFHSSGPHTKSHEFQNWVVIPW